MPKFAQLASRLSTRGWLVAGGASIAAIFVIYLFMQMISAPSYSTLMTGIEPAQTSKMTAALSAKGIAYELQNNGTALAVQSNKVAEARVALASAGMLGNGSQPGFSLFEKTSLGESSFQQQVTYQRALQGQLEQTIDQIQGVSGSQVELVLPSAQSQVFAESQQPSSAAVLLTTSAALEPSSVRGIAHLVASSVPGLKLSDVTITEGSGQLLWPTQGSEGGEGSEADTTQAAETKYDQQTAAGLDAMLAQTLGPGKAQVQVYANLNVNKTTEEQLKYGKQGVPLQQSKNLETLTGSGAGTGGTGTAAIPTYAATSGGKSNYKHEVTNTTLGVEKTVLHSTIAPGAVTSEHVSVLLDKSVPASEVPAITSAVTNAAGLETKRGDTIYIGRMAFAKTSAAAASSSSSMLGYAKDALLGIAAIVFLFFTTRFLRKRERETIDHEPIWLSELQMPVPLSELEREAAGADREPDVIATGSPARQRVEELASSSPDTVAKQLRTWMKED
jgi:flagellar M-ring protein FliF